VAAVGLRAPELRVNLCFFNLQTGQHLGLTLTLRRDLSTFAALLVSDRHRPDRTAKPRRFFDGRVDLGDAPIKIGDVPSLDSEARLDISGSVGKGQIYGRHVIEVGTREKAEHTDRVQAHQHTNHRDEDEAQEGRRRVPVLGQPCRCDQLPVCVPKS
jgi:hypothetical protein